MDLIKTESIFQFEKQTDDILALALRGLKLSQICSTTIAPTTATNSNQLKKKLREINLSEVAEHDCFKDCWIVIYDRVYDVTKFLHSHPGGEDIILDYAGRDGTIAFRGAGHSALAIKQLNEYVIGELPDNERIFRKSSTTSVLTERVTIILSDIPE